MGCVNGKKDSGDIHPNVFRVVNIDESGAGLWSGQLEITDTELVLYREGRHATVWPLRCLRRYGFDGEIFSFESGRRCTTGEGIYAFRCRRAGMLFRTLQQNIQLRNMVNESNPFQIPNNILQSAATSLPHSLSVDFARTRQTSAANVVTTVQMANGPELTPPPTAARPFHNNISSPRSPTSAEILEVTSLFPLSSTSNANHITNLYQKQDFRNREYNNNSSQVQGEHSYCNDLNNDLAMLRSNLRRESALITAMDNEDENMIIKSQYVNEVMLMNTKQPTSPTTSETSECYARLAENEHNITDPLYVNTGPQTANDLVSNSNIFTFSVNKETSAGPNIEEINTYANVNVGEILNLIQRAKRKLNMPCSHELLESDEEQGVNYAVLDIECKDDARNTTPMSPDSCPSSHNDNVISPPAHSKLMSQNNTDKANTSTNTALGYTTIDFNKTVALTSVASSVGDPGDNSRKSRHNSVLSVSSPNNVEKNKLF